MIIKVFSIYDTKLGAYLQPFFFQSNGQATRALSDLVNDKSSMIGKHPEDYVLFEIGTFDDNKGILISLSAPAALGCAIEYVVKE